MKLLKRIKEKWKRKVGIPFDELHFLNQQDFKLRDHDIYFDTESRNFPYPGVLPNLPIKKGDYVKLWIQKKEIKYGSRRYVPLGEWVQIESIYKDIYCPMEYVIFIEETEDHDSFHFYFTWVFIQEHRQNPDISHTYKSSTNLPLI